MKKIKEKDKRNDNNDNIINSKDPTEILNNDENTENRFIKQKSNIMLNKKRLYNTKTFHNRSFRKFYFLHILPSPRKKL